MKRSLDSVEGSGSALTRWALLLWCIQPLSILIEFVVAGFVQVPYSFVDNTISDLGAVTCTEIPYPAELVPVCSPAHALLNGGFIGLGAALVVGAAFLLRSQPRSRLLTIALALWLICGLSIIATGLVPLDVDLELHALVSIPAIVLQPVALALHAAVFARRSRRWWMLTAIGAVIAVETVWFILRLEVRYGGLLERIAIWPVVIALPVLAAESWRRAREHE